jgi:hypothetical protein
MGANNVNRETLRDALATLLSAALVGTGKPCVAVYGYSPGDFGGQSPIVTVTSWNTERSLLHLGDAIFDMTAGLLVEVWALWQDAAGSYTEATAEDALDLIEKMIADVVRDNYRTATWSMLKYSRGSESDWASVGGCYYRTERIYLAATLPHGP